MTELNKRLGSMDYDGLIADIYPKLVVSGGTIRKLAEAATIKLAPFWQSPAALPAMANWWCWAPRPLATRC